MDARAGHLVLGIELDFNKLSESRRVVVAKGARVAECLEKRVGCEHLDEAQTSTASDQGSRARGSPVQRTQGPERSSRRLARGTLT
eukprot:2619979-Prymnesium_polylepis.1